MASSNPLVTVITVAYNAGAQLEKTIQSVLRQTYPHIEFIVIDGGSSDGTLDVIKRYQHRIAHWVSEPDSGIYDAMNKGIAASRGDWLNFLNANDEFATDDTIAALVESFIVRASSLPKFFYSDVLLVYPSNDGTKRLVRHRCDHQRLIINHQAAVYSKSLHATHGLYLVAKGVTISDYLFFSLIDRRAFQKVDEPIALYDATGVSQSRRAVEQKFIVDYLINGMPRFRFVAYFLFYYPYRQLKIIAARFKAALLG